MSATQQAARVRTSLLRWCCRKDWMRVEASFTRWGETASSTLSQSARYLEQAYTTCNVHMCVYGRCKFRSMDL